VAPAGGRAEVYHDVLGVTREPSELVLHCRNPHKVPAPGMPSCVHVHVHVLVCGLGL
jgi:hypothetical protein